MKKSILFLLLIISVSAFAQKRKNKGFYTAGAVAPFSTKYIDYQTYTSKFVYTPKLKAFYEEKKVPFDPNKFRDETLIIAGGLKNSPKGEFRITFDVEDFQFNEFSEVDDEKAMIVGMKANVKVYDNEDVLIYSRYMAPITKAYVYNKSLRLNITLNRLLQHVYDKLIKEFNYMYTFGPQVYTNVVGLGKIEDIPELAEFDNSIEVFDAMKDLKRSEQSATLDGVIEYWKPFLKYNKIKDKDRGMDLRLAANYNTAMALVLQNKFVEAEKIIPSIKANDRTFLGMTMRDMEIRSVISTIKEYQILSKDFKRIEPIEEENTQKDYLYDHIILKNALVIFDKDEEVKGTVKLLFNNPTYEYIPGWNVDEKVGALSENTGMAAIQIASGLLKMKRDAKVEDSKILVEIEGKKKPKKIDLSDVVSIKAENGDYYSVEVMGFGDSKRYAAVKEVSTCVKVTLYQEVFPGNELLFKRNGKEDALQLEAFETDKKVFKKFFSDCPRVHAKIDAGDYVSATPKAYMAFMDEYKTLCCPPAKVTPAKKK
jgi:hypothetical protein